MILVAGTGRSWEEAVAALAERLEKTLKD